MSNIEEDLEILEEFIKLDRNIRDNKKESDYEKFCERRCIAIENILAERKQDKERIKELEIKFKEYMKQFIPKQKITDEIEKLNKEIKNGDEVEAIFKIKQQQILYELLEE